MFLRQPHRLLQIAESSVLDLHPRVGDRREDHIITLVAEDGQSVPYYFRALDARLRRGHQRANTAADRLPIRSSGNRMRSDRSRRSLDTTESNNRVSTGPLVATTSTLPHICLNLRPRACWITDCAS